jgi:hypothetical protein
MLMNQGIVALLIILAMLAGIALHGLAVQSKLLNPVCSTVIEERKIIAEQDAKAWCEDQDWVKKLTKTK